MEIETSTESGNKKLNNAVAITIVILSVFTAIMGIKSGNTAQAIDQTKADVVNKWNQYQAARLKHDIAEGSANTERLVAAVPGIDKALVEAEAAKTRATIEKFTASEKRYFDEAKALTGKLEGLNKRDDQYDVAEAILSIAIAVSAIAILAEIWLVLMVGWGFGAFGMTLGVAAMAGWDLYPQSLVEIFT